MDDMRYFNSYKSLFKINYKIYDIGGKTLPRALPLDTLVMAIVLFIPALPLGYIFAPDYPWLLAIIISGTVAWLLTQLDSQGKFMPIFIADFLSYIFRPKTTNLTGKQITNIRKHRLHWSIPEVDVENEISPNRL